MTQTLAAPRIFTGTEFLNDHALVVERDHIVDLLPQQALAESTTTQYFAGMLCPGFIDLQVNGGGGVLFNSDPQIATLYKIAAAHRRFGTTSILPTFMSDTESGLRKAIAAANSAHRYKPSQLLGIHLEGPYFNPEKKGIHDGNFIRPLAEDDFAILAAADGVKLLTLAPEIIQPRYIERLCAHGYRIWAGHTSSRYTLLREAIAAGLSGFTHLFNAMATLQAREPSVVGTALSSDECWTSIIADGHHVHNSVLEIALRCKPKGKLLLVSDAMCTVGASEPNFVLNGEMIQLCDGALRNAQGTLAGSAISLLDAVNYLQRNTQLDEAETLRMASLYPAEAIGLSDCLGKLLPGYQANLIHIENTVVSHTWINGEIANHC